MPKTRKNRKTSTTQAIQSEPGKERTLVSFDWAMKSILRDKANFDVLEGFLSALLKDDIQVINLLESEANQERASDKFNRVDLLVQDSQGVTFIIEVQYTYATHFLRRLLFGTAKLISERVTVGDEYAKVPKIISISLLYFPLGVVETEGDYVYHGRTEFYGIHTGLLMRVHQDTLQLTTERASDKRSNVFPEYYLIDVNHFPDQVKDALDEWVYFFKHSEIPEAFQSKNIQAARQKLNRMKMSTEDRQAYDRFLMARASYQDEIQSAEAKGREEGMDIGRSLGEHKKAIAIAQKMKRQGFRLAEIVEMTELSEEEVANL